MNWAHRILTYLLIAAMSVIAGGRADAAPPGAQMIEICAEDSIQIIYIDADGQPVPADPICDCAACQHCAVPGMALLPGAPATGRQPQRAHRVNFKPMMFGLAHLHPAACLARGPPAPKAMI